MDSHLSSSVESPTPAFGLRQHVLSPTETLAQSISAIAPSTSAALTIPLVFALAGEGTCLAYILAMFGMMLIAFCIAIFARQSASPGSLYVYAQRSLSPFWAAMTAWSLLFAYVTTASSVIGGFTSFTYAVLGSSGRGIPPIFPAALAAGLAMWVAYKDIQVSARLMLYIEAVSVLLILLVVGVILYQHGPHLDHVQAGLHGVTASSVRLGVVLAIFSFVGFESATTLGTEAKDPLKTIPKAVLWSTFLSGIFFVSCAYSEVLGFRGVQPGLADSNAPMQVLSTHAGLPWVGPLINLGVLVSMFAATLAFVIALSRLMMLMAHHRLVTPALGKTNERHQTPALGGLLAASVSFVPVAVLVERGATGAEVYGWMGSLAVFGYLTSYMLVAIASLHQRGRYRLLDIVLAVAATAAMLAVGIGTLLPVPPPPYRYFPVLYAAFMLCACGWSLRKNLS